MIDIKTQKFGGGQTEDHVIVVQASPCAHKTVPQREAEQRGTMRLRRSV